MRRIFFPAEIILIFLSFTLLTAMDFKPPSQEEQLRAIGPTTNLPEPLRKAFSTDGDFKSIPAPKQGDWLSLHAEKGQTFEEFIKGTPYRPDKDKNMIILQPLGEFPPGDSPSLEILKEYVRAFCGLKAKILRPLQVDDRAFMPRKNPATGKPQIKTGAILLMLRKNIPSNAFVMMAITMTDLYPEASWNFVFGEASPVDHVGIFSFARYDPAFYGMKRPEANGHLLLVRSLKVLTHETCHLFGLNHCIYFHCLMNGSNHLDESDARPLHLCPVCLRKLESVAGFDVVKRYRSLEKFYEENNLQDEAAWEMRELERISGAHKS